VRAVEGARPVAVAAARPAPDRPGPGRRGRALRAVLAAVPVAGQRAAGRGGGLGPAPHGGRPSRRSPHPGQPRLHEPGARDGPPAAAGAALDVPRPVVPGVHARAPRLAGMGAPVRAGAAADTQRMIDRLTPGTGLVSYPPPERWDD